jgi:hypothetical protein
MGDTKHRRPHASDDLPPAPLGEASVTPIERGLAPVQAPVLALAPVLAPASAVGAFDLCRSKWLEAVRPHFALQSIPIVCVVDDPDDSGEQKNLAVMLFGRVSGRSPNREFLVLLQTIAPDHIL